MLPRILVAALIVLQLLTILILEGRQRPAGIHRGTGQGVFWIAFALLLAWGGFWP